jgi:hypothetical protein
MNSLLAIILLAFDFNISNFTQNWLVYAFDPYMHIFGNITWGLIFGFVGAGVYAGSRSATASFTYLVIVGLIFSSLLPEPLIAIFVLLLTFIGTGALYIVYVTRKGS